MEEKKAVKKGNIPIPLNMILTKAGISLFHDNTQLKRIKTKDGLTKEGLFFPSYNATTIQKMVMNSYVEELYVKLPELLSKRNEIISTNNLVVYAILYKKLSPSLGGMIIESPVLKAFNRNNPKNSIVSLDNIAPALVDKLFNENEKHLIGIKRELHKRVQEKIETDSSLTDEDRNARLRSLDKFIDWIDKRIWYLYLIIYQSPLKNQIETSFASMIYLYMDNTQIATHLSNLLMEFVQNAEKAHFERIARNNNFITPEQGIDSYIRNNEKRKELAVHAVKSNQMLEVSWNLNPERTSVGRQYRIQIIISNFGVIDEGKRNLLASKMKTNTDGISLSTFYEEVNPEKLGAGLGLLYNSYLEDICRTKNIRYLCNIYPEPAKEKTTVKIDITL